jgi:hypothetical protein
MNALLIPSQRKNVTEQKVRHTASAPLCSNHRTLPAIEKFPKLPLFSGQFVIANRLQKANPSHALIASRYLRSTSRQSNPLFVSPHASFSDPIALKQKRHFSVEI